MKPPVVCLDRFEGPLDLLLALVRKNEVDLMDLPIAEITRQYLAYLEQAEVLDLELGSEFAYMAATLIQMKSSLLLPPDAEVAAREPDPRQELVRQLLNHEQVRRAAEFLQRQLETLAGTWTKGSLKEFAASAADEEPGEDGGTLNLMELLRLAHEAVRVARSQEWLSLEAPDVSVEEMARWIKQRMANHASSEPLSADVLFVEQRERSTKTALFLAMLELAHQGEIRLAQDGLFAPIFLSPARC